MEGPAGRGVWGVAAVGLRAVDLGVGLTFDVAGNTGDHAQD